LTSFEAYVRLNTDRNLSFLPKKKGLFMKYTKKRSISLILATILGFTATISSPIGIPSQVTNASISVKKGAKFAQAMAKGIQNYASGQMGNHTIIEQELAKAYGNLPIPTQESICQDVEDLYTALHNNPLTKHLTKFRLGASSSAYQIEGGLDGTSAAARFYTKKGFTIAGDALDFYNRFESIIKQLKELHINTYRISLAWDRIEPQQGVINYEAITFYRNVINTFLANDIQPLVVFHHYDVPTWFEDLGGFELEENGKLFQKFCLTVYTELSEELGNCLISMCCAPEGPAFKGYFTGEGTPGEKNNMPKTHAVIANMYYEIVDTALHIQEKYAELKKTNPQLKKPCIGTQINVVPTDPYPKAMNKFLTSLGCAMGTYVQSGGTYNFLVNGEYCMFTPDYAFMGPARGVSVYRYHPNAHKAFDWIGVNIYSNRFIEGFKPISGADLIEDDKERYTDNANYRNYPEGIYRAVQMISDNVAVPLGKLRNKDGKPLPIIVTENGIATKDNAKRTRYFQRALKTITQLIKDGYCVVGYLPWTSHDNYEWPTTDNPEGFNSKCYGFFAVNFDKNSPDYLQCTLKEGSRYYADFAKAFFARA
jgi:beta-glucosidase